MKVPARFGFYGILTDPKVGYEALAEIMMDRGVRFIQLRMKERPREEIRQTATNLRRLIQGPSLLIINDDPKLARECGADGVHLGQTDPPYDRARALLGDDAVIGLSTHTPQQTRSACAQQPNYIGVGPVFPTPTKKIPDPPIGIDGMKEMLGLATVPAVVLGNINTNNIGVVLAAGAQNICAVRCINQAPRPERVLDELLGQLDGNPAP